MKKKNAGFVPNAGMNLGISGVRNNMDLSVGKIREVWKKMRPYTTSHHPNCAQYSAHTFSLGKRQFCIGCYIGIPMTILILIPGSALYYQGFFRSLNPVILFFIGIFLCLAQLLSFTEITKQKGGKIVQKIFMGAGAGLILFGHLITPYENLVWKIVNFVMTMTALRALPALFHYKSLTKTCEKCPQSKVPELCDFKSTSVNSRS